MTRELTQPRRLSSAIETQSQHRLSFYPCCGLTKTLLFQHQAARFLGFTVAYCKCCRSPARSFVALVPHCLITLVLDERGVCHPYCRDTTMPVPDAHPALRQHHSHFKSMDLSESYRLAIHIGLESELRGHCRLQKKISEGKWLFSVDRLWRNWTHQPPRDHPGFHSRITQPFSARLLALLQPPQLPPPCSNNPFGRPLSNQDLSVHTYTSALASSHSGLKSRPFLDLSAAALVAQHPTKGGMVGPVPRRTPVSVEFEFRAISPRLNAQGSFLHVRISIFHHATMIGLRSPLPCK